MPNSGVAETYANHCYLGHQTQRWWADPRILVGGSIVDAADFEHLQRDFGVTHVISVESEHADDGKVPPRLLFHHPVPDDGSPPTVLHWARIIAAASVAAMFPGFVIYVHCQMGGSRSPAAAYAIMRGVFGMRAEDALAMLRTVKADYGEHAYHRSYIDSFERAWPIIQAGTVAP